MLAHGALIYGEGPGVVARDLTDGSVRWSRAFAGVTPTYGEPGVFVRGVTGSNELLVDLVIDGAQQVTALESTRAPDGVQAGSVRE